MVRDEYRPPSLLTRKGVDGPMVALGLVAVVVAHVGIPFLVLFSQWLMVQLGLAIGELRPPPPPPDNVIAAEFVKLGKPFDPTKLPNRKVPPIAKVKPDGVVVSKDAQEKPKEEEEEKEKPKDAKEDLLDNLVDRTKDFAEDVEPIEEEGDPNGIREGTATTAKAGDIYAGQLAIFFQRNWTVPNIVQDTDGKQVTIAVTVADDGRLRGVRMSKSSGDPLFDQSALDSVQALIESGASLPEPPADQLNRYYGTTFGIIFDGKNLRR
jgi:TonB family protein